MAAPHRDAVASKVSAVIDPVLRALASDPDPHCWVAWGEEPANRYTIFVPTDPGLIVSFVRVNVPGEGPRATTKLLRWNRVAVGELAVETQAGHRLLSFQLEQQVLRGADAEADRIAAFGLRVIAAIDGRPLPPVEGTSVPRRGGTGAPVGASGSASRATASTVAVTGAAAPRPGRSKAGSDASR